MSPEPLGSGRCAVITITHRRPAHLRLQRLGLRAGPPELHVVVGMGEEPDLSVAGPWRDVPVTIGVGGQGLPLAAARNAGALAALAAGADTLVFLDVDCIPDPGLVGACRMAAGRVAAGRVAAGRVAAGRVAAGRVAAGRVAAGRAGREPAVLCGPVSYLPPPPPAGYDLARLGSLARPHPARPCPAPGQLEPSERWELFWSLSFATSATTWEALGGFDEGYCGYGAEDTDFALRAAAGGAALWWVGGATAYHQHHPPTRLDPARTAEIARNATLFRARHGWWPMRPWLDELAAAGALVVDDVTGTLHLPAPPVGAPR